MKMIKLQVGEKRLFNSEVAPPQMTLGSIPDISVPSPCQ